MIQYGSDGKGRGKLGQKVYSINHGVQVVREYNPDVTNPSSGAQVATRSRFKLMSQLSAAMAPVIVIPRIGMSSPRNRFTKKNFDMVYGTNYGAEVSYPNLQITDGSIHLPGIFIRRTEDNKLFVCLNEEVRNHIDTVAYSFFRLTDNGQLLLEATKVVDVKKDYEDAPADIANIVGDVLVLAYGIRFNSERARAKYDNYKVTKSTDIATLVAKRALDPKDVTFTQTRGNFLFAGESQTPETDKDQAIVYFSGGMNVSVVCTTPDASVQGNRVIARIGSTLTFKATPAAGYQFGGWVNQGESKPFSTENPLTLTVDGMRDIKATAWFTGGAIE